MQKIYFQKYKTVITSHRCTIQMFVCNMHGTLDILFVNVFKALFKITWCTKHWPTLFSNMWWQRRIYSASSASWQFLVTSLKAHLTFLSCSLGIIQNLSSVFYNIPKPRTIEYRALFSCNARTFLKMVVLPSRTHLVLEQMVYLIRDI